MPNPRAQKPLTLELVKKDLMTFKEPFMALADQAAGGMRGMTLATFGLPGEVESLSRSAVNAMLQSPSPRAIASRGQAAPQVSEKTFLPTMDELSKKFYPAIPEGVPNQKSRERSADVGETFGQFGVLPGTTGAVKLATYGLGRGAGALTRAGAKAINDAHLYGKGPLSSITPQVQNIVKSGGGNWLRHGLDEQRTLGDAGDGRAQSIWNSRDADFKARYPEREQSAIASDIVADWANKNMRKYMANQMGTKDDPVRKLAEQNISHFGMRPDEFGEFPYIKPSDETRKLRKAHTERTGEESPVANSSLAAYWENLSDNAIKATTVGDIKNAPKAGYSFYAKEDIAPFADKVSPETPIYNIDNGTMEPRTVRQTLGFNRILEVMREDIAAGRITPKEVSAWDMEQAVRHVDKRDKAIWKEEAEEADRLAKEFARYFPTLKEYPDKSRWIELKVPDLNSLPKEERMQLIDKLRKEAIEKDIDPEQYIEDYPRMKLEEALAHEGEKMGHCVGSYCEDVITGKSRVISYRDANGDSHVTLEVTPPEAGRYPISEEAFRALPPTQQTEYSHAVRQWRQRNPDVQELEDRHINQALEQAGFQPRPDEIKQIKGKQDAAPVGRYQPYVQDFQRMTNYPIEGDFANSGFIKQDGKYMTQAEYDDYLLNELKPPPEVPPTDGMKAGGAVHISNNPDTMAMELQNQRYQAGGVVRGLKALKGALRNPEALVPSARGATKFAEPTPKTMSIMKEKGGNWLGGEMSGATIGNVDKSLKRFKTTTVAGKTPAERIPMHERLLLDPLLNDEGRVTVQRHLDVTKGEAAIDKWIENNVGNYIKKDMATPTDPVRLMLEKRAQEIEAQFQVDMNRASRTSARAEAEEDPRRKANLIRQAGREEEQAKFDRDFANEHITHLPKDEWAELSQPSEELMQKRLQEGYQMLGEAKSDPAQRWENLTDEAVGINRAGDIQAQKDAVTKAQDAERAYLNKDDEINRAFRPRLIETLTQKGESYSDKDIDALVQATPTRQKAEFLGEGEAWNALRSEAQQTRINVNSGLYGAYSENKWVDKLDPEANVYSAYIGDLGLDHVIDVIRQDVAAGRIRPEQLNKLSMDQAIQRTAEFNMEQAKKMREAQIKNTEGLPVYKDYGDEGYKWVELKTPEAKLEEGHTLIQDKPTTSNWKVVPHVSGEGYGLQADNGQMAMDARGRAERKWNTPEEAKTSIQEYAEIQEPYEDEIFRVVDASGNTVSVGATEKEALKLYKRQEREQQLAEALKYEGDTMGHCVGGYCPDVLEGKSRIYSLRDKRGEPHVTVEVKPPDMEAFIRSLPAYERYKIGESVREKHFGAKVPPEKEKEYEELFDQAIKYKYGEPKPTIRQIKGKGNARPIEKYDPYTQDFVKSGQWSDVGDLKNTGLHNVQGKYYTEQELTEAAKKYGRMGVKDTPWEVSRQSHMDAGISEEDALANWVEAFKEGRGRLEIPPEGEGMKAGGKVHVSDNCDCMQMELDNKKFAMGGAVMNPSDVGSPSPQNSASPVASFQAGGAVKGLAALKQALTGGSAEAAKAARVAALRQSGLSVAEAKARVELAEQAAEMKQALKASEALAKIEGKHLNITQADRTKVGGGYLGGPGFSGLQMKEGPHKDVGAVWGVKNTGTAKTMLGGFNKPLGNEYFTTMIGSPTQHQSNQMVFDKLYKDFTAQAKKGNLDPALRQKINDRLASAVDKDGNAIFPSDIDILSKNFKKQASTFDQRAVAGNVLGGMGIGGKKGQIIDYEKIIRDTTDPFLLDTPSGDLGYRIWTPSGEVIERPDLHPAFPAIATGEDLGVEFKPADKNILLAPFLEKFRAEKGREPGYMDMTRGRPARVQITESLLKNLEESGNKAGGAIRAKRSYQAGGAVKGLKAFADAVRLAKTAKPAIKGMQEVLPAAEREANLKNFLKPSKVKQPVYHGTMSDVKEFRTPAYFGNKDVANQFADIEYLTGSDTLFAGEHPNVMPVHLGLRKPKVFKTESDYEKHVMEGGLDVDKWKKKGYDSVIYAPEGNLTHEDAYFVAFEPQQVKSALGNRGTYDIKEAEINKRRGGAIHAKRM